MSAVFLGTVLYIMLIVIALQMCSKALLNNSHYYHMAKHGDLKNRGIECGEVSLSLPVV